MPEVSPPPKKLAGVGVIVTIALHRGQDRKVVLFFRPEDGSELTFPLHLSSAPRGGCDSILSLIIQNFQSVFGEANKKFIPQRPDYTHVAEWKTERIPYVRLDVNHTFLPKGLTPQQQEKVVLISKEDLFGAVEQENEKFGIESKGEQFEISGMTQTILRHILAN